MPSIRCQSLVRQPVLGPGDSRRPRLSDGVQSSKREEGQAWSLLLISKSDISAKSARTLKIAGCIGVAGEHPGDEPEGNDSVARELRISFGRSLRTIRRRAGMTQTQLAERLGLSQSYVSDVELGRRNLTIRVMSGLAHSLGYRLTITFELGVGPKSDQTA